MDPRTLRRAILAAPLETSSFGEPPRPGTLYVPPAHEKALRPEANLVVGGRGVGKSFWTAALKSPELRRQIGSTVTALDRAETAQRKLTLDLESLRKTNTQLSRELQETQQRAQHTQVQLDALQASRQAEQKQARETVATLEQQLKEARQQAERARADKAAMEAQASRQLTEANDLINRQKLAAAAAADREMKLEKSLTELRQQLDEARAATPAPTDPAQDIAQLRQQLDGLVEENRRMAQVRDQMAQDREQLALKVTSHQQALAQAVDRAREEARQSVAQEIGRLQESLRLGQARLGTLTAQLQSAGKLEVLAPDQVGALMGDFVRQVESGMPSLSLAEGELKLKLGLASAGSTRGFVILQPGAQADANTAVHEVALKFDRAGTLGTLGDKP